MWCSPAYKNAVEIQRLVAKDARNPDTDAKVRCLCARAFKELEELKLRLRMKPAPKPIDVSKNDKKKSPPMVQPE